MADKKIKKIVYLTGTRADFGLMTPVLTAIRKDGAFNLKIFATGMHLMPRFGRTIREVKKKFPEASIINVVFTSDKKKSYRDFVNKLTPELLKVFKKNKPDLVLVLGDRIEMLCAAKAAARLEIPVAHIQGGDKTTTIDDAIRREITKLSRLHFTATEDSAARVRKTGKNAKSVFVVGSPGIDMIKNAKLFTREEICKKSGLNPAKKFILVTQHPVSEHVDGAGGQMRETLEAVKSFGLPIVVIYPNADPGSGAMIREIEKARKNFLFKIFKSLPYKDFLSLEKEAAVWVGNSSAGVIDSASFQTPVVNVGKRQFGRPHGANVIDVGYDKKEIIRAVKKCLFDKKFIAKIKDIKNLWGDGRAAGKIVKVLKLYFLCL